MTEDEHIEAGSRSEPGTGRVVADDSEWPILRVRFPSSVDARDIDLHFDELETFLDREELFACLIDINDLRTQTKEQRVQVANRMARLQTKASRYIVGTAHVTDHWLSRTVLTLVYWLHPPPFPNQTFRSEALAYSWLRERLAQASAEE